VLSATEQARADRFVFDRDRMRFVMARARLRDILSNIMGTTPEALPLAEGEHGKPYLPGGPLFNLSHAAGLAALVVTAEPGVLLGVDIEGARHVDPGLDAYVFGPEERAALAAVDPEARDAAFFLGWTRKEAVVKATGEGLRANLRGFAVTLAPGLPPRLTRYDGQNPDDWRLHDFRPRADLAGAIACRTGGREMSVTQRS
jgi:4'-phosphopantetheinyl transferase